MKALFKIKPGKVTMIFAHAPGAFAFGLLSLRDAADRGNFYVFTRSFIEDLPNVLSGPGRFRFILQPLLATIIGICSGIADARCGRPAYISAVLFHRKLRAGLLKEGFSRIVNCS